MANTGNDGHEEGYQQFLSDMIVQGKIKDGDQIAKDGIQLLSVLGGRGTSYDYLVKIESDKLYSKDHFLAALTELLMRTVFFDRRERLKFLEWVEWDIDFKVPLDDCVRYVASAPSEGGLARKELIEIMTSFSYRQFNHGNTKQNRGVSPGQRQAGALS